MSMRRLTSTTTSSLVLLATMIRCAGSDSTYRALELAVAPRSGRVSKLELRSFAFNQMTTSNRDPLFAPSGDERPTRPPFQGKQEMDFEIFARARVRLRFDPLDRDHDGRLSAAEVGK